MGGERYVKIVAGDVREPPVEPGAAIPTVASVDLDLVLAQAGRAGNEIQEIFYLGTELQNKVASGAGTAGKLVDVESPLYDRIYQFEDDAQDFLEALDHGQGRDPGLAVGRTVQGQRRGPPVRRRVPVRLEPGARGLVGPGGTTRGDSRSAGRGGGPVGEARLGARNARPPGPRSGAFIQLRVLQLGLRDMITALKEDPMGSVKIELF